MNYKIISSPKELPAGKSYCIFYADSHSDGEVGSGSPYCRIQVYASEFLWREAIEEEIKSALEGKSYYRPEFVPVVLTRADVKTNIAISLDLAA